MIALSLAFLQGARIRVCLQPVLLTMTTNLLNVLKNSPTPLTGGPILEHLVRLYHLALLRQQVGVLLFHELSLHLPHCSVEQAVGRRLLVERTISCAVVN